MNRRAFLAQSSALGAIALTGCMADANDGGDTGGGTTPTPTPDGEPSIVDSSIETTDRGCASPEGSDDDAAATPETGYASVSKDESTLTVSLSGRIPTPTPCYDATIERATYDAEADRLTVALGAEQTDDVCVTCIGAIEFSGTVEFDHGLPGDVVVTHDGETLSPAGGSGDPPHHSHPQEMPTIVSRSFAVTGTSGGTADGGTASSSFDPDEEIITVTGTVIGDSGCATAALESATYDADRDQLDVDVVTREREDSGVCTQQLVAIEYEATITFEGGIPKSVTVSHDGDGVSAGAYSSASASAPDDEN